MDYSGYVSNQPKMGLARLDTETKRLVVDSVLQWNVPPGWTLEDAATVPVIYALVSIIAKFGAIIIHLIKLLQLPYAIFSPA